MKTYTFLLEKFNTYFSHCMFDNFACPAINFQSEIPIKNMTQPIKPETSIANVPLDVFKKHILNQLDVKSIFRLRCSSKFFHNILDKNFLMTFIQKTAANHPSHLSITLTIKDASKCLKYKKDNESYPAFLSRIQETMILCEKIRNAERLEINRRNNSKYSCYPSRNDIIKTEFFNGLKIGLAALYDKVDRLENAYKNRK